MDSKNVGGKVIQWLPEPEYNKARFQLKSQIMAIMKPLELYGQKPIVDEVVNQVVSLAEDFSLRVRGVDKALIAKSRWLD
jgi:hypothetical protein